MHQHVDIWRHLSWINNSSTRRASPAGAAAAPPSDVRVVAPAGRPVDDPPRLEGVVVIDRHDVEGGDLDDELLGPGRGDVHDHGRPRGPGVERFLELHGDEGGQVFPGDRSQGGDGGILARQIDGSELVPDGRRPVLGRGVARVEIEEPGIGAATSAEPSISTFILLRYERPRSSFSVAL